MNNTDILLVVSDLFFLSKLTTALEAQHCSVQGATQIPAILQKAQTHKPALLILDLGISPLDPTELIAQIRLKPGLEDLLIMGYTNHTKISAWEDKLPNRSLKVVPNSYISDNIGDVVGLLSVFNRDNSTGVGK